MDVDLRAFGFCSLARSLARNAHCAVRCDRDLLAANFHIRIKHAPAHLFLFHGLLDCPFARRESARFDLYENDLNLFHRIVKSLECNQVDRGAQKTNIFGVEIEAW
jgi:hypothetical protein